MKLKTKLLMPLASVATLSIITPMMATSCSNSDSKQNIYLTEPTYTVIEPGEKGHYYEFWLPEELKDGQKLTVSLEEKPLAGETKHLIPYTDYDLTDYMYGQTVYVPVRHVNGLISFKENCRFSLSIKCVKDEATIWQNDFNDLEIIFPINAVDPGIDFRGWPIEYTRMDNKYFSIDLDGDDNFQRYFSMPIRLTSKIDEAAGNKLVVAMPYYEIFKSDGTQIEPDPQKQDFGFANNGNNSYTGFQRGLWQSVTQTYNYSLNSSLPSNVTMDPTDATVYQRQYDIHLQFKGTISSSLPEGWKDNDFVQFSLIIACQRPNGTYMWSQALTGCRLMFISNGKN